MSSPQVSPCPRFRGELQRRLRTFHARKTEVTIPRVINPQPVSGRRPIPVRFVFQVLPFLGLAERHGGAA